MNSYDAYKPYVEDAFKKARKNLCQLYMCKDEGKILSKEPKGKQACYGLFLFSKTMVSVGHVAKEVKKNPSYAIYIGCDSFNGKFYRANLKRCYSLRDLSVWNVDCVNEFPDISNLFISRNEIYGSGQINVALQRFGSNKQEM